MAYLWPWNTSLRKMHALLILNTLCHIHTHQHFPNSCPQQLLFLPVFVFLQQASLYFTKKLPLLAIMHQYCCTIVRLRLSEQRRRQNVEKDETKGRESDEQLQVRERRGKRERVSERPKQCVCVYPFKKRNVRLSSRRRGDGGIGTVLSNEQIFSERRIQREIRGRDGQTHPAVGEKPAEDRGNRTGRPCASAGRRSAGGGTWRRAGDAEEDATQPNGITQMDVNSSSGQPGDNPRRR